MLRLLPPPLLLLLPPPPLLLLLLLPPPLLLLLLPPPLLLPPLLLPPLLPPLLPAAAAARRSFRFCAALYPEIRSLCLEAGSVSDPSLTRTLRPKTYCPPALFISILHIIQHGRLLHCGLW